MPLSRPLYALLRALVRALAWVLARKSPPGQIHAAIAQRTPHTPRGPAPVDPQQVRVAVIQQQIAILSTALAYQERMRAFVAQAVEQGAQLVCFPEENGLLLLGQIPFIRWILKRLAAPPADGNPKQAERAMDSSHGGAAEPAAEAVVPLPAQEYNPLQATSRVRDLFALLTPWIQASFEATFSALARAYGVYIMAGSVMLVDHGKLVNRAYLFGPDGALLGTQDKAHLVELEMDLGLSAGSELKVFDTTLGRLAFPVCMDATYFETFKILKQMGAKLVMIPIANQEEYQPYLALRGIWPRVQESGVYGLRAALVGDLSGLRFTGRAGVFAPLELTPDHSGVIALAKTHDQDEVVTACLDLTLLDDFVSDYFGDTNPALYRRYFPEIYAAPERRPGPPE